MGVCAIFLLGALTVGAGIAKLVIFYRVFACKYYESMQMLRYLLNRSSVELTQC